MVFIHGGGFVYGSSTLSLYNPMYLMDRDVVLVTFNYRLNALGKTSHASDCNLFLFSFSSLYYFESGFLSTEDSDYPGNMGLLDQVAAFKWVKENIVHFGGNPELITIFGQSAGGASVNMHLVSPHSLRKFTNCCTNVHKLIAELTYPRNYEEDNTGKPIITYMLLFFFYDALRMERIQSAG